MYKLSIKKNVCFFLSTLVHVVASEHNKKAPNAYRVVSAMEGGGLSYKT